MNRATERNTSMGITLRTALLSWLVTIATVLIFATAIIPMQEKTFRENLESKAHGLAVTERDIAAGAVVNEDYPTVVDHCQTVIRNDETLEYLVFAKNDGFALVFGRTNGAPYWYDETSIGQEWRPENREITSNIRFVPLFGKSVYQYSFPFDYQGIQWGWIHVGLSLDGYYRSVARVYRWTAIIATLCIALSLVASGVYAKHLVHPILALREVLRQVADGNLGARAAINRGDELGSLAKSVNAMTEALRRRDRVLESIRFAAQQFLSTSDWQAVVGEVLVKIGEAGAISRILILQNRTDDHGNGLFEELVAWESPEHPRTDEERNRKCIPMRGGGYDDIIEVLSQGKATAMLTSQLDPAPRARLETRGVKSLVVLPIMVESSWWGILTVSDCALERNWTAGERDSFRVAAEMLGAAIARQATQNALIQAKEFAESANRAKSQFLANMSHEIRTPITGVMGMLQLLQRTTLDKRQNRYAHNALSAADTLLTVIGDILDFSKIEAGKMEIEEHVFKPELVVDTVVHLFAERAEGKGIELAYRIAETVPKHMLGDSNRLRQILVNLIGNAVKFTTVGEVVVTCELEAGSADHTTLRFEVRDTGCGIAPEKQILIFDPFAQADNSMTRNYGGTGLGLTISRQLCELMHGGIGLKSELGRGSTFHFSVQFRNVPVDPSGCPVRLLDLEKLRVLIVDDCATTRTICRELVAAWKGEADDAPDAALGIEKLQSAAAEGRPYDAAVLDWKMPGMDGIALARLIRAAPELRRTGLILLSSFTQQGSLDEITTAGFIAAVPKPASPSDLYDALLAAANGRTPCSPAARPQTGTDRLPFGAPTGTVLLAEDNEINREVAMEMLTELGYRCRWVRTGREAIEVARQEPIDLILMDCQMPEMDGYEAAHGIRTYEADHADQRHLPILALTAHATKGDRERCLAAGMDDYLTKPLDPRNLARMLAQWMPRHVASADAPVDSTPAPAQPIDYPSLLQRCMGKKELAARLVRKLTEQAQQDAREINEALQAGNLAAVAAAAHRLKGASANVSAEALRQVAADLENLGRSGGSLASARPLAERLQQELARLQAAETAPLPSTPLPNPQTA